MKRTKLLVAVVVALGLAGCGMSADEAAQLARQAAEQARADTAKAVAPQTVLQMRRAKERARTAGVQFARDGRFTARAQCRSIAAERALTSMDGYTLFGVEMRPEFRSACFGQVNAQTKTAQKKLDAKKKPAAVAKAPAK